MSDTYSPTVLKRLIAYELKRLREEAGRTRPEAAERLGKTSAQIGHIETMRNLPSPGDLELLLTWYGHPEKVEFYRNMLRQAKRGRDWWIGLSHADEFDLYFGLESASAKIEEYHAVVVPGLFQTRAYAAAIMRGGSPTMSDDEVVRRVNFRMARQKTVERENPPRIWTILDEATIRRMVGGPITMREQLERLIRLADMPNVEIQVMPFAKGAHPALDGTFTYFSLPSDLVVDPGVVYAETRVGVRYFEQPAEIETYRDILARLRVQALDPQDSREMIERVMKEL
ncbi:helix-turn-helix domain-containing protein [Fodinicola acaciae]|uniref:helix-turn-helix domain-containing protein n=1 Tax=Fodinicola acaciae TaxID=2681555 RepID=UPI0013D45944|nr:helix-turn-helix transcriptional regulator [Fodinicola acaciae]